MGFLVMLIGAGLMGMCARLITRNIWVIQKLNKEIDSLTEAPIEKLRESGELIAVRGNAQPSEDLVDPVDGTAVAYADIRVEAPLHHEVKGRPVDVLHEIDLGDPLRVVSGDAAVSVEIDGANWELPDEAIISTATPTAQEKAFIERAAVGSMVDEDKQWIRIHRRIIRPGRELLVIGRVARREDGYRFQSDGHWQTVLTEGSLEAFRQTHRTTVRPLVIASIFFGLLGAAQMILGIFLLL